MQYLGENTAVLFFTRSAKSEVRYKRFTDGGASKNIKIASSLISQTYHQIKKTNLPLFRIDEDQQVGSSFGEKITNAFRTIFEQGFDHVIAVGNDTPTLTAQHILGAAQKLASGDATIVLGPDKDGGTWLMGYSRHAFDEKTFKNLPWNTSGLLDAFIHQHGDSSTIALLETLSDIDNALSLQAFVDRTFFEISLIRLIAKLGSILSSAINRSPFKNGFLTSTFTFRSNLLRAPPSA